MFNNLKNKPTDEPTSLLKYEGDNDTFIWKHPIEDFMTGSQLIVHESQEAIFFMNGQALDLFGPGRHTLETQNLPQVGKIFNLATGGQTPFHSEVYFINRTEQMAIKWGTDTKLEYVEPAYGFPIKIGASGEMSLRVADSRKLLVKILGTEKIMTNQQFVQKIRAFLMMHIKNHLASYIKAKMLNIFEIDEHLVTLSQALHDTFISEFLDYGISLERFFITNIVKPEEDHNYRRFKDINFRQYSDVAEARLKQQTDLISSETQKQRMILEAEGLAHKRALEGYTYQDERGFDVAQRIASNQASGQFSNLGMGLGLMTGVSGAVGGQMNTILNNTINQPTSPTVPQQPTSPATLCLNCKHPLIEGSKFCIECGTPVGAPITIPCPHCQMQTPSGKFCMSCGGKLEVNL